MTMVETFLRERAALESTTGTDRAPAGRLRALALSGALGLLWAAAFAFKGSHLIT